MTQTAPADPTARTPHGPMTLGTIPGQTLARLADAGRAVAPSRSASPLLTRSYLKAGDGRLTLAAGTPDFTVIVSADVPDLKPGPKGWTGVQAHRLAWTAREAKGLDVVLSLVGNGDEASAVRLETLEWTVTLDAPLLEQDRLSPLSVMTLPSTTYTLPLGQLRAGLLTCLPIASREAFQAVFRTVHFGYRNGVPEIVSSDGYRVMAYRLDPTNLPDMNWPRESVQKFLRLTQGMPDDVTVRYVVTPPEPMAGGEGRMTPSRVSLEVGPDLLISFDLMDAEFPNYARVIPKRNDALPHVTLDRAAFLKRLKTMSVILGLDNNNRTSVRIGGGLLSLDAESDWGRAQGSVPLLGESEGPQASCSFNGLHLIEILSAMPDQRVVMQIPPETNQPATVYGNRLTCVLVKLRD